MSAASASPIEGTSPAHIKALLIRIQNRDEGALETIRAMFSQRIFAFALHHLGDRDEAETVLVDTLFEVWKKSDTFRGDAQFSTWLLGIARYKILTLRRSRRSHHEDIEEYAGVIESHEPTPDVSLDEAQRGQLLKVCIERLDPIRKECLHLVFFEGMNLADVAVLQAVPENTVKTRLFNARRLLKECLKSRLSRGAL